MSYLTRQLQTLCCAGALTFACDLAASEADFQQQAFHFSAETENLVVADLNGDGLQELIAVLEDRLVVYFQNSDGFDFTDTLTVEFPGESIGWDLSKQYGTGGGSAIIALLDGSRVLAWPIEGQAALPPVTLQTNLTGFLGKGLHRLNFSRDINGDGIDDFLIPGAGVINLHISSGIDDDGAYTFQPPLSVRAELRIRTNLDSGNLERRSGQSIRIPMMELRDVNSDGFDDLISRTEEDLKVFIANPDGSAYFPTIPNYSLNILEIEERLGEFDIDNLDFSNLTGILALTHEEILEDVDGDGIDDLLLREGGKVSLFGGTADGMNFSQPRQVLRSGGNVLSTFLQDENEDGLKDLWLWRVENISVGDLFVWLALSGSIAIEAFIYPNEGERFARRPARKLTIDLKFPSVISLTSTFRELEQEVAAAESEEAVFSRVAHLDSDRTRQELILMLGNRIDFYMNSIEPTETVEDESTQFLGALNYSRQNDNYEFDIRDVIENISIGDQRNREAVASRAADSSITLDHEVVAGTIVPMDLNNDEREDLIVFTEGDASQIRGLLLLSK